VIDVINSNIHVIDSINSNSKLFPTCKYYFFITIGKTIEKHSLGGAYGLAHVKTNLYCLPGSIHSDELGLTFLLIWSDFKIFVKILMYNIRN
jgi:hypothetical protein